MSFPFLGLLHTYKKHHRKGPRHKQEQLAHLRAQIKLAQREEDLREAQEGGLRRLGNCKYAAPDLEQVWVRAFDKAHAPLVERFMAGMLQAPDPPPAQHQDSLVRHQLYVREPKKPYGESTALLCRNRHLFLDTAISWTGDTGPVWWYVLFATLQPIALRAVRLEPYEFMSLSRMSSPQVYLNAGSMICFDHMFALDDDRYQDIASYLPHDPFAVCVLPGCAFLKCTRTLASDAPVTDLWQFLLDHGGNTDIHVSSQRTNRRNRPRTVINDDILRAHPWLQSLRPRSPRVKLRR